MKDLVGHRVSIEEPLGDDDATVTYVEHQTLQLIEIEGWFTLKKRV